MKAWLPWISAIFFTCHGLCACIQDAGADPNSRVHQFLAEYDQGCQRLKHVWHVAAFDYKTNVTDHNAQKQAAAKLNMNIWEKKMVNTARGMNVEDLSADIKRQFSLIQQIMDPDDEAVLRKLEENKNKLSSIYSKAKVCNGTTCYTSGGLSKLFADISTDYNTLQWAWKAWRDATGPAMKDIYPDIVRDYNTGARDHGYQDNSIVWMIQDMEDAQLNETALIVWDQLKPFYQHLHAYVRHRLLRTYPGKLTSDGPIPEHLLGNLWGQQWNNIYPLLAPYPTDDYKDISTQLQERNFTVDKIFQTTERFFSSLGLPNMTDSFWRHSILENPNDGRVIQCSGWAIDIFDDAKEDFRMKICASVNEKSFVTAHHEMGHIEYYMMYKNQPCIYRTGANAAFHEAVGDSIQLSASTPHYLREIGLQPRAAWQYKGEKRKEEAHKHSINFLMSMALDKVAFLPFALLVDTWRWSVFNGTTTPDLYNRHWWDMRIKLSGISPPVNRDQNDFDAGAKYHVANNVRYVRYYFSYILQFQFHKAMCKLARHSGPVHECDIYRSRRAGRAFKKMLQAGRSKPWRDTLEEFTGQREVDPNSVLDYFRPLYEWLQKTNRENGVVPGWRAESTSVTW